MARIDILKFDSRQKPPSTVYLQPIPEPGCNSELAAAPAFQKKVLLQAWTVFPPVKDRDSPCARRIRRKCEKIPVPFPVRLFQFSNPYSIHANGIGKAADDFRPEKGRPPDSRKAGLSRHERGKRRSLIEQTFLMEYRSLVERRSSLGRSKHRSSRRRCRLSVDAPTKQRSPIEQGSAD